MPERTDHNEAMRLAEPPNIDNLKKIAASDSTTAIRNALLASIKWIQCLEQSLRFEQAASFRDQVAELSAERDQLRAEVERLKPNAERWGKFIGLSYQVRAEWAANLSLVPVLTEWVDSLPPLDAARTTHKETE